MWQPTVASYVPPRVTDSRMKYHGNEDVAAMEPMERKRYQAAIRMRRMHQRKEEAENEYVGSLYRCTLQFLLCNKHFPVFSSVGFTNTWLVSTCLLSLPNLPLCVPVTKMLPFFLYVLNVSAYKEKRRLEMREKRSLEKGREKAIELTPR